MNNIRTVVTAAAGLKLYYYTDIKHKVLQLYDSETQRIERYFEETHEFIKEGLQNGNVLVHCFAGVSRSSTIVISYLMKTCGWTMKESLEFAKKRRKYVDPNKGFIKALKRFERELRKEEGPTMKEEETADKATKKGRSIERSAKKPYKLESHTDKENLPPKRALLEHGKSDSRISKTRFMQNLQNIYLARSSSKKLVRAASQPRFPSISHPH